MKSRIYLSEKVPNRDRRFGAALEYYPVVIVTGKRRQVALLTGNAISEGLSRYLENPEDVPEPSRLEHISASIRRWLFG